ncbi:MAG: hypothetical protein RLZZ230_748 [Candidatus Parcubacteria bacterium]|jgi:hypothetical protein
MGNAAKNLSIVLGLITVAFAGYYLYSQQTSLGDISGVTTTQTKENMLRDTQAFSAYSDTLENQITLDMNILNDKRFINLQNFSTDIQETGVGRPNPFAEISGRSNSSQ